MKSKSAILLALCFIKIFAKDCVFEVKDLPKNAPFFLRKSNVVYPKKTNPAANGTLTFAAKEKFSAACSSDTAKDNPLIFSNVKESIVECLSTGEISFNKTKLTMSQLECTGSNHERVTIEQTGCGENLLKVNIKFEATTPQSPLIVACHDPNLDASIMSSHVIHGGSIEAAEVSNDRPDFKEGHRDLYKTIDADAEGYNQKHQLQIVSDLVGSPELGNRYINIGKSYYLARGHLAPDGDFNFKYEQDASYYYFNAIPQWQAINNGNWKALEFRVRDMAETKKIDLNIYTGAFDVLKLNDTKGKLVEIYLAADSKGKKLLPVPRLSWKVIHNKVENKAIAVIMINNPHQEILRNGDIICPDICDQISWVNWSTQKDFTKGYTYCCDLTSFMKVIKILPNFGPVELLN